MIRFGQIRLELGKIKILHLQKHSISYGYSLIRVSLFKTVGRILTFNICVKIFGLNVTYFQNKKFNYFEK